MNKRYWATALVIPAVFGLFATSNALADNTTVTVNVTNISLELDVPSDPVVLTLRPTATGANFGSVDLTATVGTNNPAGYQLSVEFSDTSLIRTAAIGNDTPEINTLDDLSGGYAENDFTVNRWGQKVTGDNYFPVPSGTLAPASWSSNEPVNNADNTITLAAKADGTIPSGTYEVTLTYTLVANVNPISLRQAYADAGKPTVSIGNGRYYKMQDMNPSICESVTEIPSNLQVADIRDNTIYWIGKLADGRCWLLDNLALDITDSSVQSILSPSNTNADADSITSLLFGNREKGDQYAYSSVSEWVSTLTQNSGGQPYYTTPMSYNKALADIQNKNTVYTNDYNNNTEPLSELARSGHWRAGIYYNYCAASAGSYCYNENTGGDKQGTGIDAGYDICPSGWRMPTGWKSAENGGYEDSGEYQKIYSVYDDYTAFRTALRLPLSGEHSTPPNSSTGGTGRVWSSTIGFNYSMFDLYITKTTINPTDDHYRTSGFSVRCIAKTGTEPVSSN